jgi:hypothetical protein
MVYFFIQKKYDVHAYKHLSLKLDLIEYLWALVKAPIFIEIKEVLETCLSIVFWCPSVDCSLQHYAWVMCDGHWKVIKSFV